MKDEALAREAVEWFLKVDREEPSLETLAAWQQWLQSAPQNKKEYEATQRAWQKLDYVSVGRWEDKKKRESWRIAVGLAAAAALAFVVIRMLPGGEVHRTQVAQHREIVLPDRSRVIVGARSEIKVKFSKERREIDLLAGEAYFSVAKDAQRPFVVDAGMSRVTALGTAFNVRRYGHTVAVEVAEGRVHVEGTARDLKSGEEAVIDEAGAVQALRTLPTQNVAAWRSGRHVYIDEPLALVIADLNRYTTRPVRIEDPALNDLRITTTFFSDDWQGWLATLETAIPAISLRYSAGAVSISSRTQTNE